MNTSYFAKYKGENAVSIAGKCPDWFKGREYKKLAPKYNFFQKYKRMIDSSIDKSGLIGANYFPALEEKRIQAEEFYIQNYQKEVLDKLDAKQVYEELGENAVLLCWERPEKFCHRRMVARWLEKELGVKITEL